MEKEKCIECGKLLKSFSVEINQDWKGMKKGDTVDIYGCKSCEDFTVEGHISKKTKGGKRHSSQD